MLFSINSLTTATGRFHDLPGSNLVGYPVGKNSNLRHPFCVMTGSRGDNGKISFLSLCGNHGNL